MFFNHGRYRFFLVDRRTGQDWNAQNDHNNREEDWWDVKSKPPARSLSAAFPRRHPHGHLRRAASKCVHRDFHWRRKMMSTTPNDTYLGTLGDWNSLCARRLSSHDAEAHAKVSQTNALIHWRPQGWKAEGPATGLGRSESRCFPDSASRSSCVAAKAAAKATGKKSSRSNSSSSSSASSSSSSKSATRWALRAERSELLLAISARHRRGQWAALSLGRWFSGRE